MFYIWREATAALVPGFLCESGRRRPENVSILSSLIGSFSNDDGDGKRNRFITQNNNFARASCFLYISLPSLHGYDVKMPNCKFYGGRKQVTIQEIGINATKIEKNGNPS